jgi:hypothetical protein
VEREPPLTTWVPGRVPVVDHPVESPMDAKRADDPSTPDAGHGNQSVDSSTDLEAVLSPVMLVAHGELIAHCDLAVDSNRDVDLPQGEALVAHIEDEVPALSTL